MILRNVPAAAVLTAAAVAATAVPAHAGSIANGKVQLVMTHQGPIMIDNDGLEYNMILTNQGPDTATNVVVRTTGWECQDGTWSLQTCTQLPDRDRPGQLMGFNTYLDPIAPGTAAKFPVATLLPDENTGTVRTTVQVISSDQYDTASVPATCQHGWNPQPDCMSDLVWLS